MKKKIIGISAMVVFSVICIIINIGTNKIEEKNAIPSERSFSLEVHKVVDGEKISISEGKSDYFKSIEELEQNSDLIVRGKNYLARK